MINYGKRKKDKYGLINNSIILKGKTNFVEHWIDKMDFIDIQFNYLLRKTKEQMIAENKMNEVKKKLFLSAQKKNIEKKKEHQKKKNQLLKRHQYIQSAFNNKMMLDMLLKNKRFMDYLMTIKKNNEISNIQDNNFSKPEITIDSLSNSPSMNLYSEIDVNQISTNISPLSPDNSKKLLKDSYFITQSNFEPEKKVINNNSYNNNYYNSYSCKKTPLLKKGKNFRIFSLNLTDKQKKLFSLFQLTKNVNNSDKKKFLIFNRKNSPINDNKNNILSDSVKNNKKIRMMTSPTIIKLKSKIKYKKDEVEKTNDIQNKKGKFYDNTNINLLSNEQKGNNHKQNSNRPKTVSNNIKRKKFKFKDIFIKISQK